MNWLNKNCQWEDWPHRKGTGDDPHEKDTPPERTSEGDFIVYHGTSFKRAKLIIHQQQILHDDMKTVGVCTSHWAAGTYASMKAMQDQSESAVLQIVLDRRWFLQQELSREIGGSNRDQWLIQPTYKFQDQCMKPANIPPEAIKQIKIYSISGDVQ